MRFLLLLGIMFGFTAPSFAQHIAKTDPLSPAEELKTFKVPDGFEVQLVAAEPDIQKPIQIATDSRGRIWVCTSHHYPFAAEVGKATDKLFILSDFGPDGKAKKIETFANFLNIPIGVLPLPDCKSCIVSECGRILKLTDTNDDGKADKTEVLFTGFGYQDTHGMTNSFLLMPDGWVYATHGFKNTSKVKGKDGHEITMNSGNTYRFKPDGSRIENFTYGQVNPFGLTCDPWLNLYTADCHSKPITQLIRGAHYQSFGKPHGGLGFAPHVTIHDHGSTALCGLAWYDADHFPKEYLGTMFLGNVVTNRINFDRIEWRGATPVAKELPDFLTSSDPWCRPTDIKLGLDGALYFADFYNRIIGHYEVDLKHPQRDKDRGRVWRIVWKGKDGKAAAPALPEARDKADQETLVKDLASKNISTRLASFHELNARLSADAKLSISFSALNTVVAVADTAPFTQAFGMVVYLETHHPNRELFPARLDEMLKHAAKLDDAEKKNLSGLTILAYAARATWTDADRTDVLTAMNDLPQSVRVQRAILDGITLHPHESFTEPLIDFILKIPADDTHMNYAGRVALRGCLKSDKDWAKSKTSNLRDARSRALFVDMALAAPNAGSAEFLAYKAVLPLMEEKQALAAAELIGRYGDESMWSWVVRASESGKISIQGTPRQSLTALHLLKGVQARGKKIHDDELQKNVQDLVINAATKNDAKTGAIAVKAYLQWRAIADAPYENKGFDFGLNFTKLATHKQMNSEGRYDCIAALGTLDPKAAKPFLRVFVKEVGVPVPVLNDLYTTLLQKPTSVDCSIANDAFKTAPYSLAMTIATGLATDAFGADLMLTTIKKGEAPARLLQEPVVLDRLRATKVKNLDERVQELTKGLPKPDARLASVIVKRAIAFPKAKPDALKGKEIFTKQCAICHQMANVGAKVGPQLDGIGIRGLERLLEDTLDPNRNVDAAFRATTFNMIDGRTLTGLLLREEGEVSVVVDANGKELRIAKADVDTRKTSLMSAMPANIDTLISEAEYFHLMAYLLQQKPK